MGLVLGIGLMGWFLLRVRWAPFLDVLREAHGAGIALAAVLLTLEFLVRALRWRVLLRPISPGIRLGPLFSATLVGAAVNTLLPARAGDLARPLLAHRRTGVPLVPMLATAVVERILDLVGLLVIFLFMLATLPVQDMLADLPPDRQVLVENLRRYGVIMGLAGLGGLLALVAAAWRPGLVAHWTDRLCRALPARIARPVEQVLGGLATGLSSLARLRDLGKALGFTLVLWFNGALAIRILFTAFELPLGFDAAAFTAVAIALAVVLPQAPGFVGVFHVAIQNTLDLWRVGGEAPAAFAMVFWGISFLPVTALGLVALWMEGLSLGAVLADDRGSRPDVTAGDPASPRGAGPPPPSGPASTSA